MPDRRLHGMHAPIDRETRHALLQCEPYHARPLLATVHQQLNLPPRLRAIPTPKSSSTVAISDPWWGDRLPSASRLSVTVEPTSTDLTRNRPNTLPRCTKVHRAREMHPDRHAPTTSSSPFWDPRILDSLRNSNSQETDFLFIEVAR